MQGTFQTSLCEGSYRVDLDDQGRLVVSMRGQLAPGVRRLQYLAAKPADARYSFAGAGLPYACQEQAWHSSPTQGVIQDHQFELRLPYPNAFYAALGSARIPPAVFLRTETQQDQIVLPDVYPHRLLTHAAERQDATFYGNATALPVRTQEQILLDSAVYCPAHISSPPPTSFWGLRPAV